MHVCIYSTQGIENDQTLTFVCFYDAKHVLSAIANFLVHHLVTGQNKIGKESGDKRGRIWTGRKWDQNAQKIAQKRNIFGILGRPLGATTM